MDTLMPGSRCDYVSGSQVLHEDATMHGGDDILFFKLAAMLIPWVASIHELPGPYSCTDGQAGTGSKLATRQPPRP